MDIKLESLKRGFFKHTIKPGLIKEFLLENYLTKCNSRSKLTKEVAYCLVTLPEERYREQYRVAYNSCSMSDWKFQVVYCKTKVIKSLKDLLIIDISILNKPTERELLFIKHKWFKSDLIKELTNYGTITYF